MKCRQPQYRIFAAGCAMALLLVPAALAAPESTAKVEQRSFHADAVRAVEVRNSSGNVIVTRAAGTTATVTATKKEFSKHCRLAIDLKKSLLQVVVSRDVTHAFGTCHVELTLSVPAPTALDLRTGSGDIEAKDLNGGITFRTGSGDVELRGGFPKIDGKTGSGDIVAYNLSAEDVVLATGSGDLKLTFIKAPAHGRVDLKTGSGDAIVSVPKGTPLRSTLLNGMGDVVNEVGDTPEAKFNISARSGSGDLRLKHTF